MQDLDLNELGGTITWSPPSWVASILDLDCSKWVTYSRRELEIMLSGLYTRVSDLPVRGCCGNYSLSGPDNENQLFAFIYQKSRGKLKTLRLTHAKTPIVCSGDMLQECNVQKFSSGRDSCASWPMSQQFAMAMLKQKHAPDVSFSFILFLCV